MRRNNWKTISTLVTMIVVAGCQDNAVSPTQSAVAPATMSLAPQHPNLSVTSSASLNNSSVDFTVTPNGGAFVIGNNAVFFPANSICDPATSSYGIGTWDAPCQPLRTSIRIHAVTRVKNGAAWVDFSPSLRFVPSDDPSRWVWIYMSTLGNGSLSKANIFYAPTLGGPVYDETKTDPTLRTYVGFGMAIRRIEHFSGYVASDRGQVWCEDGAINNPAECSGAVAP